MQNKLLSALFVVLLSTLYSTRINADEIPLAQAISVIKAAENSLKSAKWDCEILYKIRVHDPNTVNLDNIDGFVREDHPLFSRYSVLFDLTAKTFIVEGNSCIEWFDGTNPRISSVFAYSYDGKSYASWLRSKGGNNEPDKDEYTYGTISVDANFVNSISPILDTKGAYVCFGTGFPGYLTLQDDCIYEACELSSVLSEWNKKGFPISLQELPDNKWAIEAKITIPSGAERVIRMHILPQDGIVVYFSRVSQYQGKEYEELRIEVDVTNIEGQHVVPQRMYVMRPLDHILDYVTFSSFKKNPTVKKDMFCISFPEGCYVDDHITKTYYKVGDLIDEDSAIDNFMKLHKLTGNTSNHIRRNNAIRYTLMGIGTIMIGIAIYQKYRNRRKSQ